MPKVLLVDDETMLLEMYKLAFEGSSLAEGILTAQSGREALEKIKQEKPDLVLLDILLPDIPGLEVLRQIKADSSLKDIPVIALTNYDAEGVAEQAVKLGAEKYLIKTKLSPIALASLVKERLNIK